MVTEQYDFVSNFKGLTAFVRLRLLSHNLHPLWGYFDVSAIITIHK